MKQNPWAPIIRKLSILLLLQPLVAVGLMFLAHGTGRRVAVFAFIPVAILGGHVGYGMMTAREWARGRFMLWAPLHVIFVPVLYWVMGDAPVDGIFVAAVLGVLLYAVFRLMGANPERAA